VISAYNSEAFETVCGDSGMGILQGFQVWGSKREKVKIDSGDP